MARSRGRKGDTPRARALGVELRNARDTAGISTRDLAVRVGWGVGGNVKITRAENGQSPLSATDTAMLLGHLGVTGTHYSRIMELAAEVADPNWLAPGIDPQLGMLADYERTAAHVGEVNLLDIPGLLQTADVARAIMADAGLTKEAAAQRVMMRMARRDVLTGPSPTPFLALIGEHAIRHIPGGRPVAREQLRHLLYWGGQPHVTIQVVPADAGWTPARVGPFVLLEFDGTRPVVVVEHYRSSATITDRRDVADYQTAVDMVRRVAMSPEESAELIAKVAEEMMERADDPTPLAQGKP